MLPTILNVMERIDLPFVLKIKLINIVFGLLSLPFSGWESCQSGFSRA